MPWIEIDGTACRSLGVRIALEEKEGDAKIVEGLHNTRVNLYRFLKLYSGLFIFMEFDIASSEIVVGLQGMGINLESFFQVPSRRTDVTGQGCSLRALEFLNGFGRDEQLAHRDGFSEPRQARVVTRNERMRRWFGLCAKP